MFGQESQVYIFHLYKLSLLASGFRMRPEGMQLKGVFDWNAFSVEQCGKWILREERHGGGGGTHGDYAGLISDSL